MSNAFVWFPNGSAKPPDSVTFYEKLLRWKPADGPAGMTMLTHEAGPLAAIAPKKRGSASGSRTCRSTMCPPRRSALMLGAELLEDQTRGSAGVYPVVLDPGGAMVALWQRA
jgi:predicted enzyme related to lactoylglutathione lyase